jgi:hypothetical protein
MGRRNREHTVIVTHVQNNELQKETIVCNTLHEALHFAKIHNSDTKAVQIFDCLGIEIQSVNKHILDFIPEQKIEEIVSEEIVSEEIQEISVEEPKTSDVSAEVLIETPKKKIAAKKSTTTAKKTTN